jgi:hypothetical protein
MMGHRHITTTERYLHYTPDPEGVAKLAELWGERDGAPTSAGRERGPAASRCLKRRAARWARGRAAWLAPFSLQSRTPVPGEFWESSPFWEL